jgi:predicted RNA binding protein YcfA (HicA-like mRNA interferase family)
MPELPIVSGQQVIDALREIGYETVGQKGSHIKMRSFYEDKKHIIVVPLHKELDRGTLMSIIRRVRVYFPQDKFLKILKEK